MLETFVRYISGYRGRANGAQKGTFFEGRCYHGRSKDEVLRRKGIRQTFQDAAAAANTSLPPGVEMPETPLPRQSVSSDFKDRMLGDPTAVYIECSC